MCEPVCCYGVAVAGDGRVLDHEVASILDALDTCQAERVANELVRTGKDSLLVHWHQDFLVTRGAGPTQSQDDGEVASQPKPLDGVDLVGFSIALSIAIFRISSILLIPDRDERARSLRRWSQLAHVSPQTLQAIALWWARRPESRLAPNQEGALHA